MSEEVMIDVVSFTDEEGKEFEMELIDEFEYKDEKYVVLAEIDEESEEEDEEACGCGCEQKEEACDCGCEEEDEACDCGCEEEDSLYIMKVVETGGEEEFVPVEDDMLEELIGVVEKRLYSEEDPEE